ncbi:hypothetical protein BS47DRAFT_1158913 [Hydnum rufescens UP504]|uniref:Uncharacterized protein n=1 Tax=Hydnum rufescens UP504 TaxID=1448309 RepID=A0A9P6ATC1_9AGAM|nr:hypothetical protein BS47DRAFT_1158913 [Hydnum rufescens UP504]
MSTSASASMSTPSIVAAGGYVRFLHNFLQGKRLIWRVWSRISHRISIRLTGHSIPRNNLTNMKEEEERVRGPNSISIHWRATAVGSSMPVMDANRTNTNLTSFHLLWLAAVDGQPIGSGSGPRLKYCEGQGGKGDPNRAGPN